MAEIRKHQEADGEGLGKLVRDALGESIRPREPGRDVDDEGHPDNGAHSSTEEPTIVSLPSWTPEGPTFTF